MSEIDPSMLEGDKVPQGRFVAHHDLEEFHEDTDLDIRGVLVNTGVLIGLCAVTFWVISLVMGHFQSEEAALDKDRLSLRFSKDQPPPAPVLQAHPELETHEIVAEAKARLESYGWNDAAKKSAHIPIDRAISILAEKGLPERGVMDQFHPQPGSSNTPKIGLPAAPSPAAAPASEPKP
ncbi:hypothetical protein [Paludisphaera rhizosphaerae]|uniref:hypothetical protein n=1 Tax=Paludisphaera rhizosphaerae TaxID=2711216 RepID=UPI0013ED0F6B|nr:hypothetical protein [Paludisphaera rhizosphaerae]